MNKLIQQESTLIGSPEDIEALENAEKTQLLIVSDSHGNTDNIKDIVAEFGSSCGGMIFCGDGTADLGSLFTASQPVRDALPPVIAAVRGNGDSAMFTGNTQNGDDYTPSQVRIVTEKRIVFKVAGRTVFAVHGHQYSVDYGTDLINQSASVFDADMVFYGHTHRIHREETGGVLVLNPGSCSNPRSGFLPTFAVVSIPGITERFDVFFYEIRKNMFGAVDFLPVTTVQ
jgi:putative phosphoesterase